MKYSSSSYPAGTAQGKDIPFAGDEQQNPVVPEVKKRLSFTP